MENVTKSSDRVDVVRCGACCFWERDDGPDICAGYCALTGRSWYEDEFCSSGQRELPKLLKVGSMIHMRPTGRCE